MFVFRKMLRTYLMDDPNVPKLPNNRYFFNAMNQQNISIRDKIPLVV